MAPQTRGQKRQITTTKATSPQTRGGGGKGTKTSLQIRGGGGGGGGGKGKGRKRQTTTKETTTTSPQTRGGTPIKETTTTSNENPDEEEQLSDDESYLPAREIVLADCHKEIEESKENSKRGLESLITFLKKMGMPAEQTFEQAICQLLEGRLDRAKKDLISKRISKYILMRLDNTSGIIAELCTVRVWDDEVVSLISESLEDFKEGLPVHVPELEDIARDVAYVLQADKERQVRMGNAVKERAFLWTLNSMDSDKMMKKWAKCPTRTIVTDFKFGCPSFSLLVSSLG